MARRFLDDINLLGFSLLNAILHPVSSDPGSLGTGDKGRVWFNTTSNKFKYWNGTAAIDLADRANHTGSQLSSTISDFTTAVQGISWGSLANPTGDINAGGQKITNGAAGSAGTDFATYGQLTDLINNRAFKDAVRAATTANVATLAGGAPNTVDGVSLSAGDRILVKDQSSGAQNGIYAVSTVGSGSNGTWARAGDADTAAELPSGTVVSVQEGTANGDKLFMLTTNGPITLGTTALVWAAYGASSGEIGVAGAGLTKTGSTYDVGAGTGISVAADSVAADFSVVARKVVGLIPATTGGIFSVSGAAVTVNHSLNNINPIVQVNVGGTPPSGMTAREPVFVNYIPSDANNVVITLPAAPSTGNYELTIIG